MKSNKRTSIILVLTSLVVMSVIYYLFRYVVEDRSLMSKVLAILFTILGILVLYLAYKELLRHLGKGIPPKEDYAVLYGLERAKVTGEVEFYFTIDQPKKVLFSLLNSDLEEIRVLADQEYKVGGHIVRYDTSHLPEGIYFYCLRSENQKTMKRMFVQHDKLTV